MTQEEAIIRAVENALEYWIEQSAMLSRYEHKGERVDATIARLGELIAHAEAWLRERGR